MNIRHHLLPHRPPPVSPALQRMKQAENVVADRVTRFAGAMIFVYIHIIGFFVWMRFVEHSPWPTLTLVVSLEAIFLSTFVMISQNRADQHRQAVADEQWAAIQEIRNLLEGNNDER